MLDHLHDGPLRREFLLSFVPFHQESMALYGAENFESAYCFWGHSLQCIDQRNQCGVHELTHTHGTDNTGSLGRQFETVSHIIHREGDRII